MSRSDEVRRIGLAAAEALFHTAQIRDLQVSAGPDASGDDAYFLDFVIDQDRDRSEALSKRLELRRQIHRRLSESGDDTFPHVRILNHAVAGSRG